MCRKERRQAVRTPNRTDPERMQQHQVEEGPPAEDEVASAAFRSESHSPLVTFTVTGKVFMANFVARDLERELHIRECPKLVFR